MRRTGIYAAAIIGALASGRVLVDETTKPKMKTRPQRTTESDLAELAKAQRKRERKAAKRAAELHREKTREVRNG